MDVIMPSLQPSHECEVCNANIEEGNLMCHYICRHPELWFTIFATIQPLTIVNDNGFDISVYELEYSHDDDICIDDIATENDKRTLLNDDICPICLEGLIEQETVYKMNVCNHNYCKCCIQRWIEDNKDCPMCKRELW